ncbi:MAG: nuclear transport factor 2 family protein [Bacteroidota bacterium]|nr:nuclear transport factor 2 family protein [Bacteroidota bacterium]
MKNAFKNKGAAFFLSISMILLNYSCSNLNKDASTKQMIKDYYAAYEKKDWSLMEPILARGFSFTSPAGDDHINLNLYKERCWPNAYKTKKFDLEKLIIDGDDAYVTYNGWTTDGRLFRNTERFKFKDGKIIENECFFGTGVSFPNNTKTGK